jgi:hypothetical protein
MKGYKEHNLRWKWPKNVGHSSEFSGAEKGHVLTQSDAFYAPSLSPCIPLLRALVLES